MQYQMVKEEAMLRTISKILFCLFFIASLIYCPGCEKQLELHARVTDLDSQLIIINQDSFTWLDVEMIINYDEEDLSSGFSYEVDMIVPGIRNFISNYEFRNPEGKQFWIYDEVHSLLIRARNSDNKTGIYTKEW